MIFPQKPETCDFRKGLVGRAIPFFQGEILSLIPYSYSSMHFRILSIAAAACLLAAPPCHCEGREHKQEDIRFTNPGNNSVLISICRDVNPPAPVGGTYICSDSEIVGVISPTSTSKKKLCVCYFLVISARYAGIFLLCHHGTVIL